MDQKVIIDTATRVVKRLTIDANPDVLPSESIFTVAKPLTLSGFAVLNPDNVSLSPATPQQVQQAGLDPVYNQQQKQQTYQQLKNAIQNVQADGTVPQSVVLAFRALVQAFLS